MNAAISLVKKPSRDRQYETILQAQLACDENIILHSILHHGVNIYRSGGPSAKYIIKHLCIDQK